MNARDLDPEHNVARYCSPRNIVEDVPSYQGFLLRSGETFLSTNWLEYFHDLDRQIQVSGIRQALSDKGFRFSPNGRLAILNVGHSTSCVERVALRFTVLGQARDPSHVGVFGYLSNDADIALALAESVRELYPAIA
jgi:hypothetical protein